MNVLEAHDVTVRFGGLVAVNGASFHLEKGEILGLIGPNGAGKTTIFNVLSGALAPTSGSISLKGEDVTGRSAHQICQRGLARTFQTSKLFKNMSVVENIAVGAAYGMPHRGLSRRERQREVDRLLDLVGMTGARDLPVTELSLARQRRLEIARALATGGDVLLLDESLAGLTPTELQPAMEMLAAVRDDGISILMVEHVMQAVMQLCDRLVVFHFGEKVAEGAPTAIVENSYVRSIYLGEKGAGDARG